MTYQVPAWILMGVLNRVLSWLNNWLVRKNFTIQSSLKEPAELPEIFINITVKTRECWNCSSSNTLNVFWNVPVCFVLFGFFYSIFKVLKSAVYYCDVTMTSTVLFTANSASASLPELNFFSFLQGDNHQVRSLLLSVGMLIKFAPKGKYFFSNNNKNKHFLCSKWRNNKKMSSCWSEVTKNKYFKTWQ